MTLYNQPFMLTEPYAKTVISDFQSSVNANTVKVKNQKVQKKEYQHRYSFCFGFILRLASSLSFRQSTLLK